MALTNMSSSGEPEARPGDPVFTGLSGNYWVARSSRAMTPTPGGSAIRVITTHFSRRAIKLEVSQRLPPIFCTSE